MNPVDYEENLTEIVSNYNNNNDPEIKFYCLLSIYQALVCYEYEQFKDNKYKFERIHNDIIFKKKEKYEHDEETVQILKRKQC